MSHVKKLFINIKTKNKRLEESFEVELYFVKKL